ncbi:MAG TPA: hypothetical protein VHB23_05070 [Devosiaceae bacterium]|jgi:hypothetical protein|nr:hypothetical protein [Devosiaceae bacterium]
MVRFSNVLFAAAVAALGAVPHAEAAAPPPGAVDLGGVNLSAYCVHYYGPSFKAAVLGSTAGDWRCVTKIHHAGAKSFGISVTNACLLQYRLPGVAAYALNWSDPLSWRCFRGGRGIHPL